MKNEFKIKSVINCPVCKFKKEEIICDHACITLYHCHECGATIKPKPGHCCVFTSYGSVPCAPVLEGQKGGCTYRTI